MREADDFKLLDNVAIVLVEPKYPENIGAAARSAKNMGVNRLIVVGQQAPDKEKMLKMATHHAAHLIEEMGFFANLQEALAPFTFVVGTTARQGRHRRNINTPRRMVDKVVPLLATNQVAILFGPEDRGLTNDDLKFCNMTSTVPTADFSSLNLAQAVAIHCYELYYHLFAGRSTGVGPKLAESREIEGMYTHLEEMLRKIDFMKSRDDYWMQSIRSFFGRLGLQAREVKMIRGFCRQFMWYEDQRKVDK